MNHTLHEPKYQSTAAAAAAAAALWNQIRG
jgi:hypothetical protein